MATAPEPDPMMDRSSFLRRAGALGLAPVLPFALGNGGASEPDISYETFPRNDLERVNTVVGASHSNIEVVRTLVTEQPSLAKASWDWGFGDWETPLGAASHVGRREIAEFLIAHGARPSIFSAAMMGHVDAVRSLVEADPSLHALHGPHGISLLRHALAGGDDARAVVDYLVERFGPEEAPLPLPDVQTLERRYGGSFPVDADPPLTFVVGVVGGRLMIGVGARPSIRLGPVSEDVFHPAGATAVRIIFEVADERAVSLTVEDGPVRVSGIRSA